MKNWIVTLILFSSLVIGSIASATTNSIWDDSVRSASTLAVSAKAHINSKCKGLDKLLELGPSVSGGDPSDALGDLRSELLQLDLLAASVRFATTYASDQAEQEASKDAFDQINVYRTGVNQTLVARVKFCGNGVEKSPVH